MQETPVRFLGQEDPLEKGTATHSSVLTWRIPWTEEPSRLQSMGLQRVRYDWETFTFTVRVCTGLQVQRVAAFHLVTQEFRLLISHYYIIWNTWGADHFNRRKNVIEDQTAVVAHGRHHFCSQVGYCSISLTVNDLKSEGTFSEL